MDFTPNQRFHVTNSLAGGHLDKYLDADQRIALRAMADRTDLDIQDMENIVGCIITLKKSLTYASRCDAANELAKIVNKYAKS